MKCLNCDKELEQIVGKREKRFCNSTCRSNKWQKIKVAKRQMELAKLKAKGGEPSGVRVDIENVETPDKPDWEKKQTEDRIKVLQSEIAKPPPNPIIGLRKYLVVRQNELNQLQAKLKD